MNARMIQKVAPSPGAVHLSSMLSDVALHYANEATDFVADQVFRPIPVAKQFDQYYVWGKAQNYRDEVGRLAPGAVAPEMDVALSRQPYSCHTRGLRIPLFDEVIDNQDAAISVEEAATQALMNQALIHKEIEWARVAMKVENPGTSSNWRRIAKGAGTATASGTFDPEAAATNSLKYWDDSGSTPIQDIRLLKRIMQVKGQKRPNTLVMGRKVFDDLIDHEDFENRVNRGQTTGAYMVNRQIIAEVLELDRVLVMDAVIDDSDEGESADYKLLSEKHALLCYTAMGGLPNMMIPSCGYTFHWDAFGVGAWPVKRYREEARRTEWIEENTSFDQNIVDKNLGMLLTGIVQ